MAKGLGMDVIGGVAVLGLALYLFTSGNGNGGGGDPDPDPGPDPAPDPCADVSCDQGYVCENGDCVQGPNWDPCMDVTCGDGEVCEDGECVSTGGDNEPPTVQIINLSEDNGFLDVEAEAEDPDGPNGDIIYDWELLRGGSVVSVDQGRTGRLALDGSGDYEAVVIAEDVDGGVAEDSFPFPYTE